MGISIHLLLFRTESTYDKQTKYMDTYKQYKVEKKETDKNTLTQKKVTKITKISKHKCKNGASNLHLLCLTTLCKGQRDMNSYSGAT